MSSGALKTKGTPRVCRCEYVGVVCYGVSGVLFYFIYFVILYYYVQKKKQSNTIVVNIKK